MGRLATRTRLLTAAATLFAATALATPAANAGLLVRSATSCDAHVLSTPFAAFGDLASYTPVPGGSFEAGAQPWALTGGAKVVAGNEPFHVNNAGDSRSLYLPAGATATSPAVCVGINEPTLRWFSKQSGGGLLGLSLTNVMDVEVLFEDSLGMVHAVPIGAGLLSSRWQPSLPAVVVANLLPLLPGDTTAVAFRFRAITGAWNVDDVYVDPHTRW
jgi:hypothetical protein